MLSPLVLCEEHIVRRSSLLVSRTLATAAPSCRPSLCRSIGPALVSVGLVLFACFYICKCKKPEEKKGFVAFGGLSFVLGASP